MKKDKELPRHSAPAPVLEHHAPPNEALPAIATEFAEPWGVQRASNDNEPEGKTHGFR